MMYSTENSTVFCAVYTTVFCVVYSRVVCRVYRAVYSAVYNVWCIVLVSHTPNQAEMRTLSNVERGAQPRVQYYQCSQQGLVWGMGH